MTQEQKALETLHALARKCVTEKSIQFTQDWGLGSATLVFQDGSHTHIGFDPDDETQALESFVDSLHALLVNITGLSIAKG